MEVSKPGESRERRKKLNRELRRERFLDSERFGGNVRLARGRSEDDRSADGSLTVSSEESRLSTPTMDMMYGSGSGQAQSAASYPLPYQLPPQPGFLQSYPHRGSSSSDTSGQTPKPVNIEQYLASQEPTQRTHRQGRAERPSSTYDHQSTPASLVHYAQSQVYPHQRRDTQQARVPQEQHHWRQHGTQDEAYKQLPQTYQRGSWDGSKPSEVDERAKKGRWGRDRSLDTVSKKRGKTLSSGSTDAYQQSASGPWDGGNRLSRDSSMESMKSDTSNAVKSSAPNIMAYTPRRAKPFVSGRSTTVDISSLDRGSQGSLGSIGDVSQPIQEYRETSFVAPWRIKDRPSSQVIEPTRTKEPVETKRQPLVKSASLDKPLPRLRIGHCDSPDLDELVEANIEAALDSPGIAQKPKKEKKTDLSRRVNDNKLFERANTLPEYHGEELNYRPAVTIQPATEKHLAQVTQVDKNRISQQETLQPPEEDTQSLSDFEKHLQDVRSELKATAFKLNKDKEQKQNSREILGLKAELPKRETSLTEGDEKAVIETLKDEKPDLANLLERDMEPQKASKAPEYHDKELADRIANEKRKDTKRKNLLFKLGEIRRELSSRMTSIEQSTQKLGSIKKAKPLMKSKSLGENIVEKRNKQDQSTKIQGSVKSYAQQDTHESVKNFASKPERVKQQEHSLSSVQKPVQKQENKVSSVQKPVQKQENKLSSVQKPVQKQENNLSSIQNPVQKQEIKLSSLQNPVQKQTINLPSIPDPVQKQQNLSNKQDSVQKQQGLKSDQPGNVVNPIHTSPISSMPPKSETGPGSIQQNKRPFSPVSNISSRVITSPLHMTTKTSTMHEPQMAVNYSSLIKSPSPQTKTVSTSVPSPTTTSKTSNTTPTPAGGTQTATSTCSVIGTQNVPTTTTSTVTTSQTSGISASSVISSSAKTSAPPLQASSLSVSDASLIKRRSKSPDADTHGAVSLVKSLQSRLTGKSSGRISPRPPDASSKGLDISENRNQGVQEASKSVKKVDETNQVPKFFDVGKPDHQDKRQTSLGKTEVNVSISEDSKVLSKNPNLISTKADTVEFQPKDLSPKPAISPVPVSSVTSNLVYQANVYKSPNDLLSHQQQQITPGSPQDQVLQSNFKPMAETLDKVSDKQSHLDLYERKHALSAHKTVASPPKVPEFGVSYLKKAPVTDKINEDLGRYDEDGIYPQVMLIETPRTANRTPSSRAPQQQHSSSEIIKPTFSSENVFQFPPPVEKEHSKDFMQMVEEQRRQREEDEMRRKELYRDDAFAKESSPEYSPIPLPKDSVILRNKIQGLERRASTSSDSDTTVASQSSRSPRLSPRTMRKQAMAQKMKSASNRGSTSSGIGGDLLHIPSGSSKDGLHMHGRTSKASPRGSTTSLPQTSRHIGGSRERISRTPPGTPQNQFQKKSQTLPANVLGRTSSADTVAVTQRQGNAAVPASDSSTSSKKGEGRRRFRKRDTPMEPDTSIAPNGFQALQTQNVFSTEQMQPIHQNAPPSEPAKGHMQYDNNTFKIYEDQEQSTVTVSPLIEKVEQKTDQPDTPTRPVIILNTEPVIHEVSYIPALTAEPVVQEIEYKPVQTGIYTDSNKTEDKCQNATISEAGHFLLHRSADSSQVNTKDSKEQVEKSRPSHLGPALLKQKNVAELKPATEQTQKTESVRQTQERSTYLSDKKGNTSTSQQTLLAEKNAPLTFGQCPIPDKAKLDSDSEFKDNHNELDSAIETLDALAKDLEERQKDSYKESAASVEAESSKPAKKPVTDVNSALSILRQNSFGEKPVSSDRGASRSIGYRPSPLQGTNITTSNQVPDTQSSKILSPPVVITSKIVSESQNKDQSARPKSEERSVVLRSGAKTTSPSRPKSGVGAGLLQRSQAPEKSPTLKLNAKADSVNILSGEGKPQGSKRPQTSYLQQKIEEQKLKNQQEEEKRKEQKAQEERLKIEGETLRKQKEERLKIEAETLRKQKEERLKIEAETLRKQKEERLKIEAETLRKQKEERLKIEAETLRKQKEDSKKLDKEKALAQTKCEQQKVCKQEVHIQNPPKQEIENTQQQLTTSSEQHEKSKPVNVDLEKDQSTRKLIADEKCLHPEKPKQNQSNVSYSPDIVLIEPNLSAEPQASEQMLMRKSQSGSQPSGTISQQQKKLNQPQNAVQKQSVTKVVSKQSPSLKATGDKTGTSGRETATVLRKEPESKQVNQIQPANAKQTNPTMKVQGSQGSSTTLKDVKQPQIQRQNAVTKQPSPQRQVQKTAEKSQKPSELASGKVTPVQPKKGPSPQRTTHTTSQRVQASPQRQLTKSDTVAKNKGASETSKSIDKSGAVSSRREYASPQRKSSRPQQKDGGKSTPSPVVQKRQEHVQNTEPQKLGVPRTVKKTVKTTTTYTSSPGQKVQRQSSTTSQDMKVQQQQPKSKQEDVKGTQQKDTKPIEHKVQKKDNSMSTEKTIDPSQKVVKTPQERKPLIQKSKENQSSIKAGSAVQLQNTQQQTSARRPDASSQNQQTTQKGTPADAAKNVPPQTSPLSKDTRSQEQKFPWNNKPQDSTSTSKTLTQQVQQEKDPRGQNIPKDSDKNSQKEVLSTPNVASENRSQSTVQNVSAVTESKERRQGISSIAKSTEDNKVDLPYEQSTPISIVTAGHVVTENKAKVAHETHFPATIAETSRQSELMQETKAKNEGKSSEINEGSKGNGGVEETGAQDGPDTMVGVALSRLQRQGDPSGKDQLTSKKYDIQSGHRDVSSLSRKFGGSVEILQQPSEPKKAVSPVSSTTQSPRGVVQQSKLQPVKASAPGTVQQVPQPQTQSVQVSGATTMQQSEPQPIQASGPASVIQSRVQPNQALVPQAKAQVSTTTMQQSKPQTAQALISTSVQQSKPQTPQASASTSLQKSEQTPMQQSKEQPIQASTSTSKVQQSKPQTTQVSEPKAATEQVVTRARRTPERAMSLRDEKRSTPERERVLTKAYSSFRDGDVKRRKPRVEKSENLVDNELQKILNRRSNYLEDWEQQVLSSEGETAADKSLAQFEAKLKKEKQSKPETVIVDRELSQMLEQRRANTDSESDSPTKSSVSTTSSMETVTKQQGSTRNPTTVTSILKQTSSFEIEIPEQPASIPSILKKATEEESSTKPVVSILKKDPPSVENPQNPNFQKDIKPILKKEPSFEKQHQHQQPASVVKTSILVTPEVKQVAKQEPVSVQKTMRRFKLQKSKTLGEMPSESSEKAANSSQQNGVDVKTSVVRPILKKAKTFDSGGEEMDPELMSLLKSRRRGSSEEAEDKKSPPTTDDTEAGSEVRLSVAERIFQMQSKIEESSLPVSKLGSGTLSTPKVNLSSKSMPTSPGLLGDRPLSLKPSETDLLTKLTDVAAAEKSATDRRNRFQKNRDNWRRRTQPITEEEVKSADALESVSSFRAEILRHTSLSFFKQQEEQKEDPKSKTPIKKVKGQETFPQPMKHSRFKDKRKHNSGRYKSSPELNQISETELLVSKENLTKKWASEINKSKPVNKLDEDVEIRPKDVVPMDIVKDKANMFKQQTIPEVQIDSSIRESQMASTRATELKKSDSTSDNRLSVRVQEGRDFGNNNIASPRGQNVVQNVQDDNSKGNNLISSQSIVTSNISSQGYSQVEDPVLSSDDDFDKLVEINARTLMEDSSSSVSEKDSLKMTKHDLNSAMKSTQLLKPPESRTAVSQPSSPEDELSKMSLSEKLSKFTDLNQKTEGESTSRKVPSSPRRLMSRKERIVRSQTQPITVEELSSVATFAKNQRDEEGEEGETKVKDTSNLKVKDVTDLKVKDRGDSEGDTTASEDDLSKLSLGEKMKLFSSPSPSPQVADDSSTPPPKKYATPRRKGKNFQSRFKTQPVTSTEVQKAAHISPLAMSLVKPPDPDVLKGLSVQEQRELTAQHAQLTLTSATPSRSSDTTGAHEEVNRPEGILKTTPSDLEKETRGILKSSAHQSPTHPSDSISADSSRKGILKHTMHEDTATPKSILKTGHSSEVVEETEPSVISHQQPSTTQGIKGILKAESPKMETDERLHSILKPGHSEKQEIRSILKSNSSGGFEENHPSTKSQKELQSTCDIDATEDTKDITVGGDHKQNDVKSSALRSSANQDLTSGSSEYHTASEPEVHHQSATLESKPQITANKVSQNTDVTMDKDRLENLDIRTVQEFNPTFAPNANTSTVATKTVVSKTSLRLSSSDTSDTDDLHCLKVVSGHQRSPPTRSNDNMIVFEEQDNTKINSKESIANTPLTSKSASVVTNVPSPKDNVQTESTKSQKDSSISADKSVLSIASRYDSSTDEEPINRRIKNEAVARRRQNRELRKSGDR